VLDRNSDLEQNVAALKEESDILVLENSNSISNLAKGEAINPKVYRVEEMLLDFNSASQELTPELKAIESEQQIKLVPVSLRPKSETVMVSYRYKFICIFGVVHVTTTTSRNTISKSPTELSRQYRIRTSLILHPSQLLQTCSLNFGLRICFSDFDGFDCQIHSYQAVPDDADIFKFCKNGNIKGIQGLFRNHLASPRDTNSRGLTPLFVSFSIQNLLWVCWTTDFNTDFVTII